MNDIIGIQWISVAVYGISLMLASIPYWNASELPGLPWQFIASGLGAFVSILLECVAKFLWLLALGKVRCCCCRSIRPIAIDPELPTHVDARLADALAKDNLRSLERLTDGERYSGETLLEHLNRGLCRSFSAVSILKRAVWFSGIPLNMKGSAYVNRPRLLKQITDEFRFSDLNDCVKLAFESGQVESLRILLHFGISELLKDELIKRAYRDDRVDEYEALLKVATEISVVESSLIHAKSGAIRDLAYEWLQLSENPLSVERLLQKINDHPSLDEAQKRRLHEYLAQKGLQMAMDRLGPLQRRIVRWLRRKPVFQWAIAMRAMKRSIS